MRRMTALIVFVACLAAAASTSAGVERKAVLRLMDRDPLTVRGEGFKARERVRVEAQVLHSAQKTSTTADEPAQRVVRASTTGTFRVVFTQITVDRCNTVRVVAIRRSGGEVVMKILPAPMCMPMRSP